MTNMYLDGVLEVLWPTTEGQSPGKVYALLDGARDPRIYSILRRSLVDFCSLYSGEISQELAEVSPYLVAVAKWSQLTSRLIELGWGKSWGVFLTSTATLQDLRQHFRRLLQVQDESGRRLLFRFYDPRVLRVYLPTCTCDELRWVFGPVLRFVIEGERAGDPISARLDETALVMEGIAEIGADRPRSSAAS
jgi:hypothetical protein